MNFSRGPAFRPHRDIRGIARLCTASLDTGPPAHRRRVVLGLPGASRPPTRADDVELGGSPRKLPPLAPGRWRSWDCRTLASGPGAAPALRGPDDVELGPVDLAGSPRRFPPLAQDGGALAGRISPHSVRPVETRLVPPPRARGSMKSGKVNPPPKEPGAPWWESSRTPRRW